MNHRNFTYEDYKSMSSAEYTELLKGNPPMEFIKKCNAYGMQLLKEGRA